MIGVLSHDSALKGCSGPGTTWTNEMNFVMNHDLGAGSIVLPVDQQSSALPLSYGCPGLTFKTGWRCLQDNARITNK